MKTFLILLSKEFSGGLKNFFFVFAVFVPLLLGIFLSLAFGTWFSATPKLGVTAADESALVQALTDTPDLRVRTYTDVQQLTDAVSTGAVSMGLELPAGFDRALREGRDQTVSLLVWGESSAEDRVKVALALMSNLREIAGHDTPPVNIIRTTLGDQAALNWSQRLLPLVVLMSVAMSGLMIAGSSLLAEREKKTINALGVTNARLSSVYLAKGLFAVLMAMLSAVIVLGVNRAFGDQPAILLFILTLGAVLTSCVGLAMGSVVKDQAGFTAAMKGLGFVLYIPGLILMFPDFPQWLGMPFPTYYLIHPVAEMIIHGEPFTKVAWEIGVLLLIDVAGVVAVGLLANRQALRAD